MATSNSDPVGWTEEQLVHLLQSHGGDALRAMLQFQDSVRRHRAGHANGSPTRRERKRVAPIPVVEETVETAGEVTSKPPP
jgi:hypothetical protein